ncbi:Aldehyde dehydrogenase family 3 member B1 [Yarrowia sp. C11]|nr:Aldehyde dehydrogenase family 3 member B1 [Yarrowia sp. C11]KAG5370447.1 Aldehyde dehydrogenase family 3 member B1 [Yarrowia sp. E02]
MTDFDWESILPSSSLDEIENDVLTLRQGFRSGKTQDLNFRLDQIRKLFYALYDNADAIKEAIHKDLGRPVFETEMCEFSFQWGEFNNVVSNLKKWAADETVKGTSLQYTLTRPKIRKRPLGTVLIISPWNYPFVLTISPLLAALAAGNTVALKFSEMCPHTSLLLGKLCTEALDSDVFKAFQGGVPVVSEILKYKFDKIMYTGNHRVGKIILDAANRYLTPVILELGGKSPVFVTKNCTNVSLAAKRALWGKLVNAGQTCVAPDYIIVEPEVEEEFIKACQHWINKFYRGEVDSDHKDFTHIATPGHWRRLTSILAKSKGNIIIGGNSDERTRFLAPTVVSNVPDDDSLMEDEIFGPILPILSARSVDEGIRYVHENHDTPLAMYVFTDSASEGEYIQSQINSGGLIFNDSLVHVGCVQAPFGGVGQSGYGSYHGEDSFLAFSHRQTFMKQPHFIERPMAIRYAPYTSGKQRAVQGSLAAPTFPRTGKVDRSLLERIFGKLWFWVIVIGLGAAGIKSGYFL